MFRILQLWVIILCVPVLGSRTVYNIYTWRGGSYFNVSGPGAPKSTGDSRSNALNSKAITLLREELVNLTGRCTKIEASVVAVRRISLGNRDQLSALQERVSVNSQEILKLSEKSEQGRDNKASEVVRGEVDDLEKQLLDSKIQFQNLRRELRAEKRHGQERQQSINRLLRLVDNMVRGLKVEKAARLKNERTQRRPAIAGKGGESTEKRFVAFSVRNDRVKHIRNLATLVFQTVIHNEGQAYNKTTGIFTTPLAGFYSFHLIVIVRSNGRVHYEMMVDAASSMSLYGNRNDHMNHVFSNGGVVYLKKNSRVYILAISSTATEDIVKFGGYLIHASM